MGNKKNFKVIPGGAKAPQGAKKQMPVIRNDRLEKLLEEHRGDNSLEKLTVLVEELRHSVVLTQAYTDENGNINLGMVKNQKGQSFSALYTSQKHLPKGQMIPNLRAVPYSALNTILAGIMEKNVISGLIINPQTSNLTLLPPVIQKIAEAEKAGKEAGNYIPVELKPVNEPKKLQVPELHNEKIEELLAKFRDAENTEEKNRALNMVLSALRTAKVVVAVGRDANGNEVPELFQKKDTGEKRFPIFTQPKLALRGEKEKKIAVLDFNNALDMSLKLSGEIAGMTIVGPEVSLNLERPMLENVQKINLQIAEKETMQKNAAAKLIDNSPAAKLERGEELTEKERAELEHMTFELEFLPNCMAEKGQAFIDELCSRKEEYMDELFEESYYDTLMYPYLAEEFSVLAIRTDDGLEAIRIDFPEADQGVNCAARAYIIWDEQKARGKYYAFVRSLNNALVIIEQSGETPVPCGPAPIEGTELQTVIDLAKAAFAKD